MEEDFQGQGVLMNDVGRESGYMYNENSAVFRRIKEVYLPFEMLV